MNEVIHTHLIHEGGYKFSVSFDEQDTEGKLHMDEPKPVGRAEGPTAAMMLSSAVGHCLSSSLLFCMEKSRATVERIETDLVTNLARNEKGRWRVAGIKVSIKVKAGDADSQKLERCKGIFEDFCIVTESVKHGTKIDVEVERLQDRTR
jgi:uncharacterized OsmC-like protein